MSRERGSNQSRVRKHIGRGMIVLGIAAAGVVAVFGLAWAFTPVPAKAQADAEAQGSVFYYNDGKTVLGRQGVNRRPVPLSRVPEHVRDAVLVAEDRQFYRESGVSISGSVRAFWKTVTGQQVQGGSTVTQQMVRNYYDGLSQERTLTRKLKEIIVALKVDREKSKDWILEQYLNTIYFGRGAYGIQAAAQAYYHKDVSRLTPAESAYLAAVIQQPSAFAQPYGPARGPAEHRWRGIAGALGVTGEEFPEPPKQKARKREAGQVGYMMQAARAELRRRGYSERDIETGGMKIVTTFDKRLMASARDAVDRALPAGTSKKVQVGTATVDPATGEVVAFYGGRDFLKDQLDNAFQSPHQAGSGFKPYVLAAALENGSSLSTTVDGSSPMGAGSDKIRNDGGGSYGTIDLVTATRRSVNTAYVRLGVKTGLAKVVDAARSAGIPKSAFTKEIASAPTLSLGVADLTAVQQASGFGSFAAGGMHCEAHVVRSVNGQKADVEKTRAFDKDTARDVSYALEQAVRGGTGTAARLPDGRPVAGKTGTTDEARAIWFTGYTPQLVTSVTIFRDDTKALSIPGYGSLYGGQLPAQIWRDFMTTAMEGLPVKAFEGRSYRPVERAPRPTGDGRRDRPEPSDRPSTPGRPSPEPEPSQPEPSDPPGDSPDPSDPPPSDDPSDR